MTIIHWALSGKPMEPLQLCIDYKIPYSILRELCDTYNDVNNAMNEVKLEVLCNQYKAKQQMCLEFTDIEPEEKD